MQNKVSLVIPGRNACKTIRACLEAVVPIRDAGSLDEIIFVDDGSTDETASIVAELPVTCLPGKGEGPGSARNIGWQAARNPLIWFIDADCVSEPDALDLLLPHLTDDNVGGVGGSYANMRPDSLLACLIHEEIIQRHLAMPARVNFLATFNVVYRRSILEQIDGFDERLLKGQDADLAWRVIEAGYELGFELTSKVKHFHPAAWRSYLRTQRDQGFWRVRLHLEHRGHAMKDSYSSIVDHIQPPLAMLALSTLPTLLFAPLRWVPLIPLGLLAATQLPMTIRLVRRTGEGRFLMFAWMSFVRAFWRGIGLTAGVLSSMFNRTQS